MLAAVLVPMFGAAGDGGFSDQLLLMFLSKVLPIMALNKEDDNIDIQQLVKPCYTDSNFVDTDNTLKTRRFCEAILVDIDSIEIDHFRDENNSSIIKYSRFSIKRILDPFEWFADHLHTPVALPENLAYSKSLKSSLFQCTLCLWICNKLEFLVSFSILFRYT